MIDFYFPVRRANLQVIEALKTFRYYQELLAEADHALAVARKKLQSVRNVCAKRQQLKMAQ